MPAKKTLKKPTKKKTSSKTAKKTAKVAGKSSNASAKAAPQDFPGRHFASYPSTVVFDKPKIKTKKSADKKPAKKSKKGEGPKPLEQLLWGDYVRVLGPEENGWVRVCTRFVKEGWVRKDEIQKDRVLEVIFVDIGQGDGSLVVTPEDKHILIDAGASDNFIRFLRWRYGKFLVRRDFDAIVISHPDKDHYAGFKGLFGEEGVNVFVGTIYHNGIIERGNGGPLGARDETGEFLTDVVQNKLRLQEIFSDQSAWRGKAYPTMLKAALDSGRVADIRMLCEEDKHMPGYGPDQKVSIEVLGPVVEPDEDGNRRLRWFGDVGKTKNGHSVVLRLRYGDISILLGGDLNIPSERLLLEHHTGLPIPPSDEEQRRLVVEAARKIFQVDIAKSCHHGSADFSDLFLEAVNPIATVISSGDEEPHAHPRSDTLGTIGRFSRGARPLIFSTELSRSASETIKNPSVIQDKFRKAQQRIEKAKTVSAKKKAADSFEKLVQTIRRSIETYGAVNVRTDGERVVIAYKIETVTRKDKMWDIYMLEPQGGVLHFSSKHEEE